MNVNDNGGLQSGHRINQTDLAGKLAAKIEAINRQVIFPGTGIDAAIAQDLADIYVALEKYRDAIDKFTAADVQNREAMEAALVGIESELKHIEAHTRNAHALFERTKTYYCWK